MVAHGPLRADFQTTPEALHDLFGEILGKAGARIVAPSDTTHRPKQGRHSITDYFVVSESLRSSKRNVAVDMGYEASTHMAVRVTVETP